MSSSKSESFIWQTLRANDRMKFLLNTGHLSDCSFSLFDDKNDIITLRCHKFVLICASPVFERMFNGDFVESHKSENIVLDDVNYDDFERFIEYLYMGDKKLLKLLNLRSLQNFIYLGNKFMMDHLTKQCFSTIIEDIFKFSIDETIYLFSYAHQMEHEKLIHKITSIFLGDPRSFFRSTAIHNLSLDLFLCFVSIFSNSHVENALVNVIEKYCMENGLIKKAAGLANDYVEDVVDEKKKIQQDKEEKKGIGNEAQNKEYIAKLLSNVQFEKMSAIEFCAGPGRSSIMDFEMKYKILSMLCTIN